LIAAGAGRHVNSQTDWVWCCIAFHLHACMRACVCVCVLSARACVFVSKGWWWVAELLMGRVVLLSRPMRVTLNQQGGGRKWGLGSFDWHCGVQVECEGCAHFIPITLYVDLCTSSDTPVSLCCCSVGVLLVLAVGQSTILQAI
jgi:hypothetical protein